MSSWRKESYSYPRKILDIDEYQEDTKACLLKAYLRKGYSFPEVNPTIYYLRGGDSNILFPFPVTETGRRNNHFDEKSENLGPISKKYSIVNNNEFYATQKEKGVADLQVVSEKSVNTASRCSEYLEDANEFDNDKQDETKQVAFRGENNEVRDIAQKRARYWERRKRNNASAKKSRDARRARELQTQIKVAFLEKENMRLLTELMAVQHENLCLRSIIGVKM